MPTLDQFTTAVIVIMAAFIVVAAARIFLSKRPTRYDRRATLWESLRATIANSADLAIVSDVSVKSGTYRFRVEHETVKGWVLFTPKRQGSWLEIETRPKSREVHKTIISDPKNEAEVMALFQHSTYHYDDEIARELAARRGSKFDPRQPMNKDRLIELG